jgi:hypothetical protein
MVDIVLSFMFIVFLQLFLQAIDKANNIDLHVYTRRNERIIYLMMLSMRM